jgi:hypothetical protein
MKTRQQTAIACAATGLAICAMQAAHAAEGFVVRYSLAGSLGGEIFAAPDHAGLIGAIALTSVDIKKVTDDNGNALKVTSPGGTVPVPGLPAPFLPTFSPNAVSVKATGQLTQWNLALGYITTEKYGGGRMVYGFNLPYLSKKTQSFTPDAKTPALNFPNPAIPGPAGEAAIAQQFGAQYQGAVTKLANQEAGEVSGMGDAEVALGWLYSNSQWRVQTGASLVMPTGHFDAAPGPDTSDGKFYTLRPSVQVTYLPKPDIALAGKITMGFNTKNRDNNVRSGDWASVEGAVGYMTRLGPIGVHMLHVRQYEDDVNNPYGTSRFRSTNAGVFWTTKIPVIDTIATLQYMTTTSSRNAKSGDFIQLRLVKVF